MHIQSIVIILAGSEIKEDKSSGSLKTLQNNNKVSYGLFICLFLPIVLMRHVMLGNRYSVYKTYKTNAYNFHMRA
jgi:hypothetical protein